MTDFIAIYDNQLTPDFCEACIARFEKSPNRISGRTGQGVELKKKNSSDITLNSHPDEWGEQMKALQQAILAGLIRYVREHPILLSGAISLQTQAADGQRADITRDMITNLEDAALTQLLVAVYRLGTINIQKYLRNEGGYFHWHSEHYPHPTDSTQSSLHRVLLWMFFLNGVEEGGQTEFYYQNKAIAPKQSSMIIAPAGFTHTHRGAMPISGDKYIFTGWVLIQDAATLYGSA